MFQRVGSICNRAQQIGAQVVKSKWAQIGAFTVASAISWELVAGSIVAYGAYKGAKYLHGVCKQIDDEERVAAALLQAEAAARAEAEADARKTGIDQVQEEKIRYANDPAVVNKQKINDVFDIILAHPDCERMGKNPNWLASKIRKHAKAYSSFPLGGAMYKRKQLAKYALLKSQANCADVADVDE